MFTESASKVPAVLRKRWKAWLSIGLLLATGYWCFAMRVDWWLFHFHSSRISRDALNIDGRLRATGLPVSPLGQVTYGGVSWSIPMAIRSMARASRTLCIFSGVHGNEPAGVEATLALASDLGRQSDMYPGVNVVIVPLVNPTGWVHDLRHNAENKDIARKFVEGSTQESALIKTFLAKQRCDTLVDLHEDRLGQAAYLLSYGSEASHATAKELAKAIAAAGFPMKTSVAEGVYYLSPRDYPQIKLTTLSLYAQMHGVPEAFIAETPMRLPLNGRVAIHRLVLDMLATTHR